MYRLNSEYSYRYAQLKRDGIWITMTQNDAGTSMFTRHPTDLTVSLRHVPNIQKFIESQQHATLYCELYAPGFPASSVKSFIADAAYEKLQLEVFATPSLPDDAELELVQDFVTGLELPFTPWRHQNWDEWRDEPDTEGLVFKDGNLVQWSKYKLEHTVDLIIKDFTDGRGKYVGLIGSMICTLADGTIVANVSGMTDDERVEFTMNSSKYIGAVIEVQYQYVGSKGRLRHPRYKRLRWDKPANECVSLET